jgi:hypothetical protein
MAAKKNGFKLPKGVRRVKVDLVKVKMMLVTFNAHTHKKSECLTVLKITKDEKQFRRVFDLDDGSEWDSDDADSVYVTKKRF